MLPMSSDLRRKIKMSIKNRLDISNLIRDVDIKGENLSYAIIKDFTRVKCNISRVNLSNAVIGQKGKVTNISNNVMRECNFGDTTFIGTVFMRRCDCKGSDFSGADCRDVQYQNSDMQNCKFCECNIRLGTSHGIGAKFSQDFFADLAKGWNVVILKKEDYEELIKIKNETRTIFERNRS